MAETTQVLLGAIAVVLIICVPIAFLVIHDFISGRWDMRIERMRERRNTAREHRRQVRALRKQKGMPIERVAADLRRLRHTIAIDEGRSAAHQLGNRLAYDKVLSQACQMLAIEHNLDADITGMERDIERLRVEAELERAGVVLSEPGYGQAA